jgi:hypothetical protein
MAEVTLDTLARLLEDLARDLKADIQSIKSINLSLRTRPRCSLSFAGPLAVTDSDSASVSDLPIALLDSEPEPETKPEPLLVASTKSTDAASSPPKNLVRSVILHPLCAQILHRPGRIGCSHFIKLKPTSIRSSNNLREDLMKHQWRPPPSVSVSRSSRYLGLRQPLPVHDLQHV